MRPSTRAEFIQHCKEVIGEPLFKINITQAQLENRVSEALDMFNEYHREATEVVYVATPITTADIARGYIETPPGVHFVIRMLANGANAYRSGGELWTVSGMPAYPFMIGGGSGAASGYGDDGMSSLYMYLVDQQRAEYDLMYNAEDTVRWNRHTRRLYIETNTSRFTAGRYLMYEAYVTLESLGNSSMWDNDWLKRYAAALISQQWGKNLTKYTGGSLFGGDIQHNGPSILADANAEIAALREELNSSWTAALPMFIG